MDRRYDRERETGEERGKIGETIRLLFNVVYTHVISFFPLLSSPLLSPLLSSPLLSSPLLFSPLLSSPLLSSLLSSPLLSSPLSSPFLSLSPLLSSPLLSSPLLSSFSQSINDKILSLDLQQVHAKIKQVDSHITLGKGIVIQVCVCVGVWV